MLAWLHQATPTENENIHALLKMCVNKTAFHVNETSEQEDNQQQEDQDAFGELIKK